MNEQDRVTTTNPPQASEVRQNTDAEQNQSSSGDDQQSKSKDGQSQPPANDSPTEGTGTGARAGEYS